MDYCSFIWLCSNGWIINIAEYRFPVRSYESDILISFPDCRPVERCHLPAWESGRARGLGAHGRASPPAHTHLGDVNINRQPDKHAPSHTCGGSGTEGKRGRGRGRERCHPARRKALPSPFEDFKNHLGPLSIFVKQVNQRATAH